MHKLNATLASTLLIASTLLYAGVPAFAEKVLEGTVCSSRVHELTSDIHWYDNLKEAEKTAAEQNKLIVWVHMVGKIDGAT
jgi:hypothetical protein